MLPKPPKTGLELWLPRAVTAAAVVAVCVWLLLYGQIVLSAVIFVLCIAYGVALVFSRPIFHLVMDYTLTRYPFQTVGLIAVLIGGVAWYAERNTRLINEALEREGVVVSGLVRKWDFKVERTKRGRSYSSEEFDVIYKTEEGGIFTKNFTVKDSLRSEFKKSLSPEEIKEKWGDLFGKNLPEDGPKLSRDTVQVKYRRSAPSEAVLIGDEPVYSAQGEYGGIAAFVLGITSTCFGILKRPKRNPTAPSLAASAAKSNQPAPLLIARGGDQFGPYTNAEAQALLAKGQLLPTDLAWREGMGQWVPLSVFLGFRQVRTEPPPEKHYAVGDCVADDVLFSKYTKWAQDWPLQSFCNLLASVSDFEASVFPDGSERAWFPVIDEKVISGHWHRVQLPLEALCIICEEVFERTKATTVCFKIARA